MRVPAIQEFELESAAKRLLPRPHAYAHADGGAGQLQARAGRAGRLELSSPSKIGTDDLAPFQASDEASSR